MFAASRTRRRSRMSSGSIAAASSFNSFMAWPGQSSGHSSKWVIACANIARWVSCCLECPISSGVCSRILPTKDFCAQNLPRTSPRQNCCAIQMSWSSEIGRGQRPPLQRRRRLQMRIDIVKTALPLTPRPAIFTKTRHL